MLKVLMSNKQERKVPMTSKTIVIPVDAVEIAEDAFASSIGADRLYIKEGADIDYLPGHVAWDCVKVPQSQYYDFFELEEMWKFIRNGFFSGTEVQQPELTFKKCDDECVRWMALRPREFQYICSQAFNMPEEECEEVEGRWLFTRSLKSGNLLLQLAAAFMNGAKVEQDLPMALKCCEHACWCAIGDEIPFSSGETFSGIEVFYVGNHDANDEMIELFERANRLKEEVLTHFQRIDIRMFELVGEGNGIRYYRIPDHAFEGRDDLRNVLLPDELCDKHVRIGQQAFARCPNLRSITVAGMTDSFALSRRANSFEGCNSLSDRIQYSADGSKLLFCLNAPKKCVICDHVRRIADFAFSHSRRLFNFRWGRNDDRADYNPPQCWAEPREIGQRAFEGCNELVWVCTKGVDITLGARAFADCRMLFEFAFGDDAPADSSHVQVSFLDISAQGVFERCEKMRGVEGGCLVIQEGSAGAQFARCRDLIYPPPIIATRIPSFMFESCDSLCAIRCVNAQPDIVKAVVVSKKRPAANFAEGDFCVSTQAFAHCHSLERFEFCRLRVTLSTYYDTTVELVDDNPKQVLFEHEAFLDCSNLKRRESSFSGALVGSDSTAFSGTPGFEGFAE